MVPVVRTLDKKSVLIAGIFLYTRNLRLED